MPEYKLAVNGDKAIIVDENGQPISSRLGEPVMNALQKTYPRLAWVYILHCESRDIYKIGMTSQSINTRMSQVRYEDGLPDIKLIHAMECASVASAADLEFMLHSIFAEGRVTGEWFEIEAGDIVEFKAARNWLAAFILGLPIWMAKRPNGFVKGSREETIYERITLEVEAWSDLYHSREEKLAIMRAKYAKLEAVFTDLDQQMNQVSIQLDQIIKEYNDLACVSLYDLRYRQNLSAQ
jgi:hypothetical protein